MKAWLKGGLIGLVVGGVLIAFFAIFSLTLATSGEPNIIFHILSLPFLLPLFIVASLGLDEGLILLLFVLLEFFLIGTVIGWIVGKMKSGKATGSVVS